MSGIDCVQKIEIGKRVWRYLDLLKSDESHLEKLLGKVMGLETAGEMQGILGLEQGGSFFPLPPCSEPNLLPPPRQRMCGA